MKAVIYARYSSDKQREESIDGQLRECMEYADDSIGKLPDDENNSVNPKPTGLSNDTIALIIVACVIVAFIVSVVIYAHHVRKKR